jgi:hypothetical protein
VTTLSNWSHGRASSLATDKGRRETVTTRTTSEETAAEVAAAQRLARPVVVMVSRDGHGWQAEIAALGVVRRARRLAGLDRQIHELLGPAAADYQFLTGDEELDRLVRHVRSARSTARTFEARARHLTERVLSLPSGGSVRDLAVLLGLSYQRIQQLLAHHCRTADQGQPE